MTDEILNVNKKNEDAGFLALKEYQNGRKRELVKSCEICIG
jgi:hypothetical protein